MLCHIADEIVVEKITGRRIETKIWFVKERNGCTAGKPDKNSYCRELPTREFSDIFLRGNLEVLDDVFRQLVVPIGEELGAARRICFSE